MKQRAVTLIEEAVQAGAREYQACAVLGISPRTLRRWRGAKDLADHRRAAPRHCPQALGAEEKTEIIELCNRAEYQSLPPSQIVPRLADCGRYLASESSFYRVLKEQHQLEHRGRAQPPRRVVRPEPAAAKQANTVWSWDITYLPTLIRGLFLYLYPITRACLRHHIVRDALVLHSDNGSPMKGATMLATLQRLGVMPSFSRPPVSDDHPYSEALFRTVKYTPAYPSGPFADLEAARQWVAQFVTWYNTVHLHSAIRFVTPAQRHTGEEQQILAHRSMVYAAAKAAHPLRWRGRTTRNWNPIGTVWLNPANHANPSAMTLESAA